MIKSCSVVAFDPEELDTVNVTSNDPGLLYVTVGFCAVLLDGDPPGKLHDQLVGELRLSSVKWTTKGVQPSVLSASNAAMGGVGVPQTVKHVREGIYALMAVCDAVDQELVFCTEGAMMWGEPTAS